MNALARPEIEPKTPLGQRLREVRRKFGVEKREDFAQTIGVSREALAMYERGENVPTATVIAAYRERYRVNLEWLVTGEGEMFGEHSMPPDAKPELRLNASIFKEVKKLIRDINAEAKIRLADDVQDEEAVHWYNELVAMARGNLDEAKLRSLLPTIGYEIEQAVRAAAAAPGTGKREAS